MLTQKLEFSGIDELELFFAYGSLKKGIPFFLVVHNIDLIDMHKQSDFYAFAKDKRYF